MEKTNVMRLLERAKVEYQPHECDCADGAIDGVSIARKIGIPPESGFKTLVTRGADHGIYVFVVPSISELDLKKAAKAVGSKSVSMVRQSELLPLTGYVHGGCSPVGMKKRYPTVLDASAQRLARITVSAGKVGMQVTVPPAALAALCGAQFADLAAEREVKQLACENNCCMICLVYHINEIEGAGYV